ncbi:MAG: hypothetical protein GY937_18805 [bacterium]|nr:hypothetical protein [bacterium]
MPFVDIRTNQEATAVSSGALLRAVTSAVHEIKGDRTAMISCAIHANVPVRPQYSSALILLSFSAFPYNSFRG